MKLLYAAEELLESIYGTALQPTPPPPVVMVWWVLSLAEVHLHSGQLLDGHEAGIDDQAMDLCGMFARQMHGTGGTDGSPEPSGHRNETSVQVLFI